MNADCVNADHMFFHEVTSVNADHMFFFISLRRVRCE